MQILFIDESGSSPSFSKTQNNPFFVLGGVIIPDEIWHSIKADLELIKRKFNITGEIK